MPLPSNPPRQMRGADGTNAGASGYVPAPAATDNVKLLHGDGTFKAVSNASAATDSQASAGTSSTTFVTPANAKYAAASVINPRAPRQALAFDGTANAALAGIPTFGTGDFTVAFVINPALLVANTRLVNGISASFGLTDVGDGTLRSTKSDVTNVITSTAGMVTAGTTTHVAYTRSGTTATFYRDGIAWGTGTDAQDYTQPITQMGGYPGNLANITGVMQPPRIFNRALTAAEVLALYQEGAPRASDYGQGAVTTPTGGTYAYWFGTGSVTGGTATSFTLGAGASGCYVRNNVYVTPIVPGRYYRVTVTVTGTITGTIFFQGGANTAETPFSGTGSYILYAANITTTANPAFNLTSVAGGTVTVNSVVSLGLLCAPDANQPGRGLVWQDVSGNNADLTLPASGVRWVLPSDTALTDVASVTAPATTNLTLSGGSSGASLALGQGTNGGPTLTALGTGYTSIVKELGAGPSDFSAQAYIIQPTPGRPSRIGFIDNSGTLTIKAIVEAGQVTGTNDGYLSFRTRSGATTLPEVGRFTSTGNLLIGGTTDITGTGGLKAFGATAATNTTSGAFQLGNNVGLSGNSGGPSYFGGSGTFGTANTANNGVGSYGASPAAGNFGFTSGSITGTNMYGFTDQTATYTVNGAATEVMDYRAYATLALGANALTSWYGFQSTLNSKTGAGVLTNAYGFHATSPTAATNNYAFYSTGTALSQLGGNLTVGQAASFPALTFGANSSQIITTSASGLAYWDIASSAGGWNFRNTFNGSNVFTFGGTGNFTSVGNGAFGPSFTPNPWGTGGQLDVNGTTGGILGLAYAGTAKGYVLAEAGGIIVNSHAGGTAKFNTSGSGATTIGNSAGVTLPAGIVTVSGTTEANLILNATSSTSGLRVWNLQSASDSFKLRLLGDALTPVLLTPLSVSGTGLATFANGLVSSNATSGLGYSTGAGGAVTQLISRTTGVTLNKVCGQVTLFTAAGSATATSFTVTNSAVAATDVVRVSVASATNKYLVFVTATAAGSFEITFYTTGGTAADAPVFNFAVLKAVTA